jgi:hypothetical protein
LLDAHGRTRALVLELGQPADWRALGAVWRGVQAELGWPAPAIAANGVDGMQLWFALAAPVAVAEAAALLLALCQRWLPEVAPARLRLYPQTLAQPVAGQRWCHAPAVPALRPATDLWAIFVAPDLAPLFAETPGLDVPPGDEGQAKLLAPLDCLAPADWASGWRRLAPAPAQVAPPAPLMMDAAAEAGPSEAAPPPAEPAEAAAEADPRAFLLSVMNDAAAPLALRIEAAKALLPGR